MLPVLVLAAASTALADEHEGTLVLKVDGKDVTLKLTGGSYGVEEAADLADFFIIGGEKVILQGRFDLNGDGKTNGKDRFPLKDDEIVKPAPALNKPHPITPTKGKDDEQEQDSFVELPGLGRMEVLKGSTLTLTKFRVLDGIKDRWAGTVKLVLKGEKGQKTVTGTFECGTSAE